MTDLRQDDGDAKNVASVERALNLLLAFSIARPRMTLADLAEATGLYKSTILRLAQTLEALGFLSRSESGQYYLGSATLQLARLHQEAFEPAEVIIPALRLLVEETGESACFNIRNGDNRVCLYRIESHHRLRDHVTVGDVIPLKHGAAGHILEAFSGGEGARNAQIRKKGYSVSLAEVSQEVAAIAAPVFKTGGELAGAITVSGPRSRIDDDALKRLEGIILKTADILSKRLGSAHSIGP
ncbi:transcriptional regulator, IclR family [Beijerinckia sp. 28-YEA-48]|nr:transcriptional regulator, IclR family [Beijerinckia sp. 28-YEA-48]